MDDHMTRCGPRKIFSIAALAGLAGIAAIPLDAAAQAESLPDPTRPPSVASAGSFPAGPVAAHGGPTLQSVIISPTRRAAIIDGETVELGGGHGDAKLVKVSESEVVLKTAEGLQTLKLFPGVEKRLPGPSQGVDRTKRTTKKMSRPEAGTERGAEHKP